ncbi:MAG: serine hydrolase [Parcubacteria group bacterium]
MLDLYLFFLFALFGYNIPTDYSALLDDEKVSIVEEVLTPTSTVGTGSLVASIPPIKVDPYARPPRIEAEAGIVVDPESGKILWERKKDTQYPIASLTKLMTATVILDAAPDFSSQVTAVDADERPAEGSWLQIREGETVTLQDLLAATLIGSRNNAVRMLVRGIGITEEDCLKRMNEKASNLGMVGTHFTDVTGLDPANVSTASDLAKLVTHAFTYERLRTAALSTSYDIVTFEKKRVLHIETTNRLLPDTHFVFRGAKTGYLDEAGYTFAAHVERQREQVIMILLGAPSADTRFTETAALADWAFRNYRWFSFFTTPPT